MNFEIILWSTVYNIYIYIHIWKIGIDKIVVFKFQTLLASYYINWIKTSRTYSSFKWLSIIPKKIFPDFISYTSNFLDETMVNYRTWFDDERILRMQACIKYPQGYYMFHILPQIYTANHANFPIQMYAITV